MAASSADRSRAARSIRSCMAPRVERTSQSASWVAMHERMLRTARDLSAEEAATVTAFLHAMAEAVEAVDERQLHEHVEDCRHPGPGGA